MVQTGTTLQTEGGSDDDDDKEKDGEEQTSGTVLGHTHLTRSVYGNNPQEGVKRKSKPNVVWDVVK